VIREQCPHTGEIPDYHASRLLQQYSWVPIEQPDVFVRFADIAR
jgi:hypothetical protein